MIRFTDERPADDASLSAADRAYHWIRDAILTGRLPAGSHLNERELSVAIGVSRTPVREAIRRVESGGMARSGAKTASVVVAWTEHDLHEVFDLRATLEGKVASLAAARATPDHIAGLEGICDAMEAEFADASVERPERLERASDGNTRFHGVLLDATGSERLPGLLAQLSNTPFVFRTYRWFSDDEVRRSMGHHRELVSALKAGDADWAATTMRAHILSSRANLLARAALAPSQTPAIKRGAVKAADEALNRRRVQEG